MPNIITTLMKRAGSLQASLAMSCCGCWVSGDCLTWRLSTNDPVVIWPYFAGFGAPTVWTNFSEADFSFSLLAQNLNKSSFRWGQKRWRFSCNSNTQHPHVCCPCGCCCSLLFCLFRGLFHYLLCCFVLLACSGYHWWWCLRQSGALPVEVQNGFSTSVSDLLPVWFWFQVWTSGWRVCQHYSLLLFNKRP